MVIRNSHRAFFEALLTFLVLTLLAACATRMSEEDKYLWGSATNAVPAGRP